MYELRNLAIPFGILLTKYAFQLIVDKNKKKTRAAKGTGKKMKGGACSACGLKRGGNEVHTRHVQKELDDISAQLRDVLRV